jgi:DNA-binding NarL/FixJ family response regulator
MSKKRVVIVDDHPLVRERLAQLFNHELDMAVCGEANNVKQAMETVRRKSPDLVTMEITLKDSSGLDLIKNIRQYSTTLPILVLSMHEELLYAGRVLRAGANGYITKNQQPTEVVAAVRRVLDGEIYVSHKASSELLRSLSATGAGSPLHCVDRLADRELAVLELIGKGRTTREIAASLGLQVPTIDTYRARIKEKLNLNNVAELLHFAIRWMQDRE